MKNNVNTISHWYGRLGNNIQQICNGILFSSLSDDGFISLDHELIKQIYFNVEDNKITRQCRFFHYNTKNKDFDIDLDYLYENIGRVAKKYVTANFKFNIGNPFDDNTIVIHIRSGDIFAHEHNPPHDYVPNPLYYYLSLIEEYDKVIVVTEPDNYNPIIDALKENTKVTIQSKSVAEDFSTLLRSRNIASSGTGTFAVSAALCSSNLQNFYCSNLYLDEHLNPEMIIHSGVNVHMMQLDDYIQYKDWRNDEDQRKFILTYKNAIN